MRKTEQRSKEALVQLFLDQNIARLPFSIDPFLGLGPFAHHFLFDHNNKAPTKLTSTYLPRPHSAAKQGIELALSIPTNILGKAKKNIKTLAPHQQLPLSPTSWATHTLALTASTALACHLNKAISIIQQSQPNHPPPALNILDFPYHPTIDNPILLPFLQTLNTCA
jgi:hypothetical protein